MSHLLLVEDEDPVGENMLRELTELGGRVDRVRDGTAAIRKLSSGKYEGVVLDLKLGTSLGPQGLSVLDELKQTQPDIAVVVVTAHPHLAVRALEIGVDALLYKPVEGSHVMQYLRRAIELRQLRRENAKLYATLRTVAGTYATGVGAAVIFVALLMLMRWLRPDDLAGLVAASVLCLLALVGSRRIVRLKLGGPKVTVDLDMHADKAERSGEVERT